MQTLPEQFTEVMQQYFKWALDYNIIQFDVTPDWWSAIYIKDIHDGTGKDIKWKLVCAQSLKDHSIKNETGAYDLDKNSIINRITLMLAEKLRSALQDINILYENKKTRD